jgi:hypothetical protein
MKFELYPKNKILYNSYIKGFSDSYIDGKNNLGYKLDSRDANLYCVGYFEGYNYGIS